MADRMANEIERSAAATSHVAEERIMNYNGGSGNAKEDEEDKSVQLSPLVKWMQN